ncbi:MULTISPECIES: hypothetical protein [unclassified Phyllobacterium]|uniref:hypothetical protein n=1 Tax=Phyllobacterium TaxID=28100 RepID=UPI0015FAB9FD|nr:MULTISPECIES: hypothetical protein [unclassified Phyllobacterium]MBA8901382.1 hypothetical protein [Phyllobacterium sp. P30BS-XVII]UGX84793.1 hypothetical protein LLE53_009750 [Phyllobacterium sp. T1293]
MSNEQICHVAVSQKNDTSWYYVLVVDGEAGPQIGPYKTEREAQTAGEKELADLDLSADE